MSNHESDIQVQIIDAIRAFFLKKNIKPVFSVPSAPGQTHDIESFGRKPHDFGVFANGAALFFMEVKELTLGVPHSGSFDELRADQQKMISVLSHNGVDIRYVYNTWKFDRNDEPSLEDVLIKAHVRDCADMVSTINYKPVDPAMELGEYLQKHCDAGLPDNQLVKLLSSNANFIDKAFSMPLMIMVNLDEREGKFLIQKSPVSAINHMKELFNMETAKRNAYLRRLKNTDLGIMRSNFAVAIFKMKDEWVNSNKNKLKP